MLITFLLIPRFSNSNIDTENATENKLALNITKMLEQKIKY